MWEYETTQAWFDGLRPSRSYKRHGLAYLREFCKYAGKDPDQLVLERKTRFQKDRDARVEERWLDRWHQELLQSGIMASTAQGRYSKIVSFFNYNFTPLVIPKFPSVTPDEYRGPKRLRKEEIQQMLRFSDSYRSRLLLLIGAETGFRVRALSALTLKYLVKQEDGSKEGIRVETLEDPSSITVPCRVQLPKRFYFGKKKEGITFLCSDAVKTAVEYLKRRKEQGEPIGPETPLLPTYKARVRLVESGGTVTVYLNEWHPIGSRVLTKNHPGSHRDSSPVEAEVLEMSVTCSNDFVLEKTLKRLRVVAGIRHDPESERPPSIHSLRKYLHTTLDSAGVNATLVNVIIGHSNSIADHYSGKKHLDLEEIRHAYESAMHRIAITEETNGPLMHKLERRVQELEAYNEKLQNQLDEYTTVKGQLSEIQQQKEQLAELQRQVEGLLRGRSIK